MARPHHYLPLVFVIAAIGLITMLFVSMDGARWIQSSLLATTQEEVVLSRHVFSTGLPLGWTQGVCGEHDQKRILAPYVCLQGSVTLEMPENAASARLLLYMHSPEQTLQSLNAQLVLPQEVLSRSITVSNKDVLEFSLPTAPAASSTAQMIIKVPAHTTLRLDLLELRAVVPQRAHSDQEQDATSTGSTLQKTNEAEPVPVGSGTQIVSSTEHVETTTTSSVASNTSSATTTPSVTSTTSTQPTQSAPAAVKSIDTVALENAASKVQTAVATTTVQQPRSSTSISPTTTLRSSAEATFPDVTTDNFARNAIQALSAKKVIEGYTDGLFKPFASVNRAEWSKMLILSLPEPFTATTSPASASLQDIVSGDWFSSYVTTLAAQGVVRGYPDGTFRAGNPVTRAEALKMIVAASGLSEEQVQLTFLAWNGQGNDIVNLFKDVSQDQWFAPYLYTAYTKGLLKGKQGASGLLAEPLAPLSRGEAAELLYRFNTAQ